VDRTVPIPVVPTPTLPVPTVPIPAVPIPTGPPPAGSVPTPGSPAAARGIRGGWWTLGLLAFGLVALSWGLALLGQRLTGTPAGRTALTTAVVLFSGHGLLLLVVLRGLDFPTPRPAALRSHTHVVHRHALCVEHLCARRFAVESIKERLRGCAECLSASRRNQFMRGARGLFGALVMCEKIFSSHIQTLRERMRCPAVPLPQTSRDVR